MDVRTQRRLIWGWSATATRPPTVNLWGTEAGCPLRSSVPLGASVAFINSSGHTEFDLALASLKTRVLKS